MKGWSARARITPHTGRFSSARRPVLIDVPIPSDQESFTTISKGTFRKTARTSCSRAPRTTITGAQFERQTTSAAWRRSGFPWKVINCLADPIRVELPAANRMIPALSIAADLRLPAERNVLPRSFGTLCLLQFLKREMCGLAHACVSTCFRCGPRTLPEFRRRSTMQLPPANRLRCPVPRERAHNQVLFFPNLRKAARLLREDPADRGSAVRWSGYRADIDDPVHNYGS